MQNRTPEDGGIIFGADGGQYDFESDTCEQGPAIHIVGDGDGIFDLDLHVYKIR